MLSLPGDRPSGEVILRKGDRELSREPVKNSRVQVRMPDEPGLYTLIGVGAPGEERTLSVNPAAQEAQLTYLKAPALVPLWQLDPARREGQERDHPGRTEPREHLATTLVVVAAAVRIGGLPGRIGLAGCAKGAIMSTHDPVVERRLDQAANRWKWLRFGQHAATLGAGLMVLLLLVGAGRVFGGLPAKFVVASLIVLALLTPLALMVLVLAIVNSRQERAWLARAWERAYAPLLDRLNTLIYLEQEKETPITESFAGRIKKQAHAVLARKDRLPAPFPATRALIHGLIFAALLLATLQFYARYKPWEPPPVTYQPPPAPSEPPPLVLPPPESVVEKEKPWGEVRITKPGVDLAVTPAEDVPLQIEAATNRPLQSVNWFTAVNGGEEQSHALPPPDEPLFAAYQPVLIPQDMHLAEWDVVTYHAQATTQDGLSFRSEVYFVEIRPFRAAILEETGGEHTELYEILNELTGMIEQQQEVIRQTYRGEVRNDGKPTLPDRDRNDLARSEDDLAQGAEHLAARLAAATDHPAVKDPVERLGEARSSLKEAAGRLRNDAVPDAQRRQRDALAQLVAARSGSRRPAPGTPTPSRRSKTRSSPGRPRPGTCSRRLPSSATSAGLRRSLSSRRWKNSAS